MTQIVIGLAIALTVSWLALAVVLFSLRSPGQTIRDIARVLPDSLRLAVSLYRDRALPKSVRWRLRIALIYNLQPINLIPDFVPVIGFADNVVVLAWALRGAVRVAGPVAVTQRWKGSPAALATLLRALRLSAVHPTSSSLKNLQDGTKCAKPFGQTEACQSS